MPGPYWCIRLTTRTWKNRIYRLPPKKDCHVHILHVVSITTHTHDRRKSIGKKKQRKEKEMNEIKETTRRRKNEKGKERRENTRKHRENTIHKEESREGKIGVFGCFYNILPCTRECFIRMFCVVCRLSCTTYLANKAKRMQE